MNKVDTEMSDELRPEYDLRSLRVRKPGPGRQSFGGSVVRLEPDWDVDLLSEDVVKVYRASEPETPTVYRHGELAEAEPAVPGWSMAVDDLFS